MNIFLNFPISCFVGSCINKLNVFRQNTDFVLQMYKQSCKQSDFLPLANVTDLITGLELVQQNYGRNVI